ncbi:Oidioi.mRNA.OKI2018_I69.chr2.g4915.t1.cds [Oikopleura dioica]|uniref:Oidioi.mRNA.OKI2018_I69.chr2.g4915.t1.cds n=1 Tax=Oikopleura dioica TaxID=34765 RepID=A0ABN7SYE2_OIKDI|nr:Oidioi.mRNA.OKI2018_I69.chr2.g4915.t1.cds [Oikopleura dioica]
MIILKIISNTGHNVAADYWSLGILVFELLSKRTPFRAKDDLAIYEGILRGIHSVQFPYKISRKAENLIKALCRQEPSERIGYQKAGISDIRKHRWFQGFDWEGLQQVKVVAPHVPDIKLDGSDQRPSKEIDFFPNRKNAFDMSNFEKIKEEDLSKIPDETSGWDAEF